MPDIIIDECPFCKQKTLKILHIEESFSTKRKSIRSGNSTQNIKNPERYEVLVDKCPNCGKSKKEIENALKHGKEPTNEELVKRLKEAGLDLTKLK